MSDPLVETADVETELEAFVDELLTCERYQELVEAREALEADAEAQELLDAYRETERELQNGEFDTSLMSELRSIQKDLSELESVRRHREAREAFESLLAETDEIVSERIGQAFAQSIGGGCC
ncbi:YlbF family regulator [Haloferax sp. Atlit-10N]|uniref:halo-CC-star protein HcsL n=1 Tax=Haloferax TaxID=2251 RepID=UPI000677ECF5|nr:MULTISPECIES: halo-CC-star protein HcsL [Haloferax]RDZ44497.1 YlbF family regulator [Haloferax sp. Atlit-16N]RDZ56306.1 YlbF family regulator [Haloferax sp. Atlit-10N]